MWLLPQGEFYPKQQSKSNNIKEAKQLTTQLIITGDLKNKFTVIECL
jgi:hypothetical protein